MTDRLSNGNFTKAGIFMDLNWFICLESQCPIISPGVYLTMYNFYLRILKSLEVKVTSLVHRGCSRRCPCSLAELLLEKSSVYKCSSPRGFWEFHPLRLLQMMSFWEELSSPGRDRKNGEERSRQTERSVEACTHPLVMQISTKSSESAIYSG